FFDEDFFMYTEDLDLGVRIILAGYKNVLAENSIVYHKYSFSRNVKKFYYIERNRYLFLFKNFKIATLILISPALIFMEIGMIIFSLFSGWWRDKFLIYGYFSQANNWNKIIKKRKKIRQIRKIYDKDLFKKFVGKIFYQDPPMNQWIWTRIISPLFNFYFALTKKIIFW
ncbi:MAG: hypothetical protein NT039_01000, partial [Candidatus Berkelbacteria bacterium]|nr:hypothetical protein [Candidatus Berkelbacteria bacterium]